MAEGERTGGRRKARRLPAPSMQAEELRPAETPFDLVRIDVPCTKCGEMDRQFLRELEANNHVACTRCGLPIDVSSKEWRAFINKATNHYKSLTLADR
jgi:hypothetical protein